MNYVAFRFFLLLRTAVKVRKSDLQNTIPLAEWIFLPDERNVFLRKYFKKLYILILAQAREKRTEFQFWPDTARFLLNIGFGTFRAKRLARETVPKLKWLGTDRDQRTNFIFAINWVLTYNWDRYSVRGTLLSTSIYILYYKRESND